MRVLPAMLLAAVLCPLGSTSAIALDAAHRAALLSSFDARYDETHAGWGEKRKSVDAAAIELSFARLDEGDQTAIHKIRRTLDAAQGLIDPTSGGLYDFSDTPDWQSPVRRKSLAVQADALIAYIEAYARWQRPADLQAAQKIYGYVVRTLAAPDGAFFTGQKVASPPKNALHLESGEFAGQTGRMIQALCRYYDVTGVEDALARAVRAANWAQGQRALRGGGFGHSSAADGPDLEDNIAMSGAFAALYRSTGERAWLQSAVVTLHFIDSRLRAAQGGYVSAADRQDRDPQQNALVARTANMLSHYTGAAVNRKVAEHAMQFLNAYAAGAGATVQPDILLADHELGAAPVHLTIVGGKQDPHARALHAAALRYPTSYLQVDWWDRTEGPLPDPTIEYPVLPRAAAFACTASACSTPVYDAAELQERVRSLNN